MPTASAPIYSPTDPAFDIYGFYDWARKNDPVHYFAPLNVWMVTRHDDIMAVLRDPARFSSSDFVKPWVPWPAEVHDLIAKEGFPIVPTLVDADPPAHTRIRALFSAAFTPRTIEAMEPTVRALAHALVDGFADDGRVDAVSQYGYRLPMTVIMDLLGVPREDMAKVKAWHDDWISIYGFGLSLEQSLTYTRGLIAYQKYYEAMLLDRQKSPRDDLATALGRAQVDGASFTMAEMIWQMIILLSAGHETTTNLIVSMLHHLLHHPAQWQALSDDPKLIAGAIEETLRFEAPLQCEPRIATEPVVLRGISLPKGARVHVMYGSGGRDPEVFSDPDRFNILRDPSQTRRHLSFGHGIHFCLGAPLARLEGRIAIEVLRERLPSLRLAPGATPEWLPHPVFRGLKSLPLVWE